MIHKKCGFREKIKVCSFKAEDCNSKECGFFDIEFNTKAISKQIRLEQKRVKKLSVEKEQTKEIERKIKDIVTGVIYLTKAYTYLKWTSTK